MLRTLTVALLVAVMAGPASGQELGTLRVKVVLTDAERKPTPVPRHAMLVSDNPATAPPRRIVTGPDGTVSLKLRPGSYTVESDRPVAFDGKAYQWTELVDIAAGTDVTLTLTADNAEVGPITPATTTSETAPATSPAEDDPVFLLNRWRDSVVALWTPTARASGFVVDATGLVATSQRVVGTATSVEVQLTAALKVAARVLVADPARDVAILRVDSTALASRPPVPLACTGPTTPSIAEAQDLFAIGAPHRGPRDLTPGTVRRIEPLAIVADFRLAYGSIGGPVFTADGTLVGISAPANDTDGGRRGDTRVVRASVACAVLMSIEAKMRQVAPPGAAPLPVEPSRPFPKEALEEASQRLAANLMPPQLSSSDFDITFITPTLLHAAQQRFDRTVGRERAGSTGSPDTAQERKRLLTDFANWSEYVADVPPVLLVRVTPKLKEGFWTMVARAAAMTQGMSLPPFKRFTSGLSRMRVLCGTTEVTPIHPFMLERQVSEKDVILEGLYAFDPGALGPHCGTVKLVLYSQKEPDTGDTRVVDPKVLQQIWQDFAPYRAQPQEGASS